MPTAPEARTNETVIFTVRIPRNMLRALRVYCGMRDQHVNAIVGLAISRYLEAQNERVVSDILQGKKP